MRRLSAFMLLASCAGETGERPDEGEIWSTSCRPDPHLPAILYPDGTYAEIEGGRGRWQISNNALHIVVLRQPDIQFASLAPELISQDEDNVLPFIDQHTVEAEAGAFKTRIHRCS